jgi:hypothetical protein
MVIVKATADSEANPPERPGTELLEAMHRFNEELARAGVLLVGEGLAPSQRGKRVRFDAHGKRTVTDGPFAETRELVAGFWLWQVRSMDEAMEWVRRCPAPFQGTCQIEVRPLLEAEDFGAALSPDLRVAEERLRAGLTSRD